MSSPLDVLSDDERALTKRGDPPKGSAAMKAVLTDARFDDPEWIFERKLDGIRCIAVRDGGGVKLWSRNDLSLNDRYPEIAAALETEDVKRFAVDGEVVAFEGSQTSFARLAQRHRRQVKVFLYVFDVLWVDGARRAQGAAARPQAPAQRHALVPGRDPAQQPPQRRRDGVLRGGVPQGLGGPDRQARRQPVQLLALEGLAQAQVRQGPGARRRRVDAAEGHADRARRAAHGLLRRRRLPLRRQGRHRLRPAAAARARPRSSRRCAATTRPSSTPPRSRRRASPGSSPELVGEIGFTEWTTAGRLRHPRFLGLRDDKSARKVVREAT